MRKSKLRERLQEECEVVKRLEHQHYLDGLHHDQHHRDYASLEELVGRLSTRRLELEIERLEVK